MPHIHLETTSNIPENEHIERILVALCDQLAEFEGIESSAIKGYYTRRETVVMGAGAKPGFIHCTVMILSGRPLELRRQIAQSIAQHLEARFQNSIAGGEASVTVELREMDRDTYIK